MQTRRARNRRRVCVLGATKLICCDGQADAVFDSDDGRDWLDRTTKALDYADHMLGLPTERS